MDKLLAATDGSKFSQSAIREATNLAKICSAKLITLSVVTTNPEFEEIAPKIIEKAEQEARAHLEPVKAMASGQGVECEIILYRSAEPFQGIVDIAAKNRADMIIMGTHGRTALRRLMMGSVTAKVIGHAPCNVLVVPLDAKIGYRTILLATDGSRYSDAAASEAFGIAKRCGSSLIILSVAYTDEELESPDEAVEIASAEENVKKVVGSAKEEGIKTEGLTLRGNPYKVIVETSRRRLADLIVVGSHGRTGLERLLMGSVTERVIGHAESAVLVVRA